MIRAVISTLTCTSMANNSMSSSELVLLGHMHMSTNKSTVAALGLKYVIN